ncbi:hypothetical protein [Azospirillum sp.]|uniref:hypothetical protein n=1 Tax=Azospirillum sp. TaxID=34012 RepID=UPI00261C554E|nr:hypothetical protein [Azospirillum sp.]
MDMKKIALILCAMILPLVLGMETEAASKKSSSSAAANSASSQKTFPPAYRNSTIRPTDGARSTVYGNNQLPSGKIGDPHGHTVVGSDGKLKYSRLPNGTVIYDDKKK